MSNGRDRKWMGGGKFQGTRDKYRHYLVMFLCLVTFVSIILFFRGVITQGLRFFTILHVWTTGLIVYVGYIDLYPEDKVSHGKNILRFIALASLTFGCLYMLIFWHHFSYSLGVYTTLDYVVGTMILLPLLYASYEAFGPIFTMAGVVAILYGRFGYLFPGLLKHGGLSFTRVLKTITVEMYGVFGRIPRVGARYISPFLFFAGFILGLDIIEDVKDILLRFVGKSKSGLLVVATLASSIIASVSGSSTANVAATGSVTIPTMKSAGVRNEVAAAVEAAASTGGQIVPPVMGAAAFIMASITGVGYPIIMVKAIVPALLLYASTLLSVVFIANKEDIQITEVEVERHILKTILAPISVIVGVVVVIYLLGWLRYTPGMAAIYAIAAFLPFYIVVSLFELVRKMLGGKDSDRTYMILDSIKSFKDFAGDVKEKLMNGLMEGGTIAAKIMMALTCMGIIYAVLERTGVVLRLAMFLTGVFPNLLTLSIGVLIVALGLGLGMPTVAAYILTVLLLAPALTRAGVPLINAHFFVFYAAILACITPPVAMNCVVAARMADADFVETSKLAIIKIFPEFLLPFAFIFMPGILQWNPFPWMIIVHILVGELLILVGMIGHTFRPVNKFLRIPYVIIGILVMFGQPIFGWLPFFGSFTSTIALILGFALLLDRLAPWWLGHKSVADFLKDRSEQP